MQNKKKTLIDITAISTLLVWTVILTSLGIWGINNEKDQTRKLSEYQARSFFQEIVTARSWNAAHGGVYAPVTPEMQPNPYLEDPERDIITQTGRKLTKINPAYMTRQIAEIAKKKNFFWFHITSEKPIRPANAADKWESQALKAFQSGATELSAFRKGKDGETFRYMAPLWVEKACLRCHASQGYSEGDLRGGISVTISAEPILDLQRSTIRKILIAYFSIWVVGLVGITFGYRKLKKEEIQRASVLAELKESFKKIKTLSSLLPICSHCKNVRDDNGYWQQIDAYIEEHSDTEFSHSICRDCAKEHYPDLDIYDGKDD